MVVKKTKRRIRRMCFDTESNCFKHYSEPWGDIPYMRAFIARKQDLAFHAGVICDRTHGRYLLFSSAELEAFIAHLSEADELVSFNARRWDLLILEAVCGRDRIERMLWSKPHHDLRGWRSGSLEDVAHSVLGVSQEDWRGIRERRFAELDAQRRLDADKIANAWRDTHFTSELFKRYLAEGSGSRSFPGGSQEDR